MEFGRKKNLKKNQRSILCQSQKGLINPRFQFQCPFRPSTASAVRVRSGHERAVAIPVGVQSVSVHAVCHTISRKIDQFGGIVLVLCVHSGEQETAQGQRQIHRVLSGQLTTNVLTTSEKQLRFNEI